MGTGAIAGYRLLYEPGRGVQLQRVGNRGTSVVDTSANAFSLEDKKFHTLEWTRRADGQMKVLLDGQEILSVVDRGFSDPFDGVRLSDKGGDFILRKIAVYGT